MKKLTWNEIKEKGREKKEQAKAFYNEHKETIRFIGEVAGVAAVTIGGVIFYEKIGKEKKRRVDR